MTGPRRPTPGPDRATGGPARSTKPEGAQKVATIAERFNTKRGVIVAGRNETAAGDIVELARRLRWPLIADHRSGCRFAGLPFVITRFDALLRAETFRAANQPEVVLRVGEIMSSKAVSQWLSELAADVVATRPKGRNIDPEDIAATQVDEVGLLSALLVTLDADHACSPDWVASWIEADNVAVGASQEIISESAQPNEITIAQAVVEAVPTGGALMVSSSMPVRDVEWFGPSRSDIDVYSNRGANGIDGVVATAIGIALTGRPTVCLIGDVAFLHDSTSLVALRDRQINLSIVVIDNDGGGIFSFLPQHQLLDVPRYELLFGTPHGTDLERLCDAHGLSCARWPTPLTSSGVSVVIASTDRDQNLALHKAVNDAVAEGLG